MPGAASHIIKHDAMHIIIDDPSFGRPTWGFLDEKRSIIGTVKS